MDHKNLTRFTTTKELIARQFRYAKKLTECDFIIIYKKGSKNGKADALNKRPDHKEKTVKVSYIILHTTSER